MHRGPDAQAPQRFWVLVAYPVSCTRRSKTAFTATASPRRTKLSPASSRRAPPEDIRCVFTARTFPAS